MTFTEALRLKSSWKSQRVKALSEVDIAKNDRGLHAVPGYLAAIFGVMLQVSVGNAYAEHSQHLENYAASQVQAEKQRLLASSHPQRTARKLNLPARSGERGDNRLGISDLTRTVWWQIGLDQGVDPYLLYAVALTESARVSNETAVPWPWALNRNGRTIYPDGPEAAVAHVRSSVAAGNQMIDVGLMQVNLRWHGRRVSRPEDLIDPVTNLQVGADILAESIASAPGDLALGVGRYHSWNDREAAYRYGRKVLALADLIKTTRGW